MTQDTRDKLDDIKNDLMRSSIALYKLYMDSPGGSRSDNHWMLDRSLDIDNVCESIEFRLAYAASSRSSAPNRK